MRSIAPLSEPPEDALLNRGDATLLYAGPGSLKQSVQACLGWLHDRGAAEKICAVIGGRVPFATSVLGGGTINYGPALDWREVIRSEFHFMLHEATDSVRRRGGRVADLKDVLEALSAEDRPTADDLAIVASAANQLAGVLPSEALRRSPVKMTWRVGMDPSSRDDNSVLRLQPRGTRAFPFFALQALRDGDWARALPEPLALRFAPFARAGPGVVPVFSIGEIKGLERDVVLLVMQGKPPEPLHELFVGVSRARSLVAVALDDHAYRTLSPRARRRVTAAAARTA